MSRTRLSAMLGSNISLQKDRPRGHRKRLADPSSGRFCYNYCHSVRNSSQVNRCLLRPNQLSRTIAQVRIRKMGLNSPSNLAAKSFLGSEGNGPANTFLFSSGLWCSKSGLNNEWWSSQMPVLYTVRKTWVGSHHLQYKRPQWAER